MKKRNQFRMWIKKDTKVDETVNNLEKILKNTKESATKIDTLRNNQTNAGNYIINQILKHNRKHYILNISSQKQTEERINHEQ